MLLVNTDELWLSFSIFHGNRPTKRRRMVYPDHEGHVTILCTYTSLNQIYASYSTTGGATDLEVKLPGTTSFQSARNDIETIPGLSILFRSFCGEPVGDVFFLVIPLVREIVVASRGQGH